MAQATFEEISASDCIGLYNHGYSIWDLVETTGFSYTRIRNMLLRSGVKLRTKREAFQSLLSRRPEWNRQFIKHFVPPEGRQLSDSKVKLLFALFAEGCIHKSTVQFTNNEPILRNSFSSLMKEVYNVNARTKNKNVAYVSSIEIADDLRTYHMKELIPEDVMNKLLSSPQLTRDVLRILADTEGSVTICVRKAPRNYTVSDRSVTIACTNFKIKLQLVALLKSLGITGKIWKDGVIIAQEHSLREFASQIGFSSGVKVIRKKAGHGVWFNFEKAILLRLVVRIYDEQKMKGHRGKHIGVFMSCKKREEVMNILNSWYKEQRGDSS